MAWLDALAAMEPGSVSLAVMKAGIIALARRPQATRQGLKPPSGRSEQPAINRPTI